MIMDIFFIPLQHPIHQRDSALIGIFQKNTVSMYLLLLPIPPALGRYIASASYCQQDMGTFANLRWFREFFRHCSS